MLQFLIAAHSLDGATVLEVGGGVGEIQLALLKRGATRAPDEVEPADSRVARCGCRTLTPGLRDRR